MYGTQQFAGQQVRPQQYQYGTVGSYYPTQTTGTDFSSMFTRHDANDHDGHDDGHYDAHDEGHYQSVT